jgi:periplasmic protein TonB
MFNNLIESSSHTREFKRRGSFFLFTVATYFLLFVIAGVASIYAYDARMDDLNREGITMLSLKDLPEPPAAVTPNTAPPKGSTDRPNIPMREIRMAPVDNPQVMPDSVSSVPNKHLPIPSTGHYGTGPDSDPPGPVGGGEHPGAGGSGHVIGGGGSPVVEVGTPPPPPQPPAVKAVPRTISKGPITGLALSLPKPLYPPLAKQARADGPVNVQVLIDETGKVVSAKAVSGNPMLRAAAQQAAFGARFSPTRLGDQPVKVSGVITYNFLLQP